MNACYEDILSRIDEAPKWWDEYAVPRFCHFTPSEAANIYASQVVLLRIECQGCGVPFLVAISQGDGALYGWTSDRDCGEGALITGTFGRLARASLAERVEDGTLLYGDPPRSEDCCGVGSTMNSIPREVVEFWERRRFDWTRRPDLERPIACDWAEPEAGVGS